MPKSIIKVIDLYRNAVCTINKSAGLVTLSTKMS